MMCDKFYCYFATFTRHPLATSSMALFRILHLEFILSERQRQELVVYSHFIFLKRPWRCQLPRGFLSSLLTRIQQPSWVLCLLPGCLALAPTLLRWFGGILWPDLKVCPKITILLFCTHGDFDAISCTAHMLCAVFIAAVILHSHKSSFLLCECHIIHNVINLVNLYTLLACIILSETLFKCLLPQFLYGADLQI